MSKAARAVRSARAVRGGADAPRSSAPLRLLIPAGRAAPGPPLGPILGQRGIPISAFCQDFNERSRGIKPGVPLRVRMLVHPDRTYELSIGPPPSSYFLKAVAGVSKGASRPGHQEVGVVSLKHLYEVAVVKQQDPAVATQGTSLASLVGSLVGSARSLGLRVVPHLTTEDIASFQQQRQQELEASAEREETEAPTSKKK